MRTIVCYRIVLCLISDRMLSECDLYHFYDAFPVNKCFTKIIRITKMSQQ